MAFLLPAILRRAPPGPAQGGAATPFPVEDVRQGGPQLQAAPTLPAKGGVWELAERTLPSPSPQGG
eukprot:7945353-Lingulodinium_polyedra.AAC.1